MSKIFRIAHKKHTWSNITSSNIAWSNMMRLIQTPFLAFLVASCSLYTTSGQSGTKRLRGGTDAEESKALVVANPSRSLLGTVTCRVTIESTSMEDGTDQDVTMCIPVKNGREIDQLLPITLPESLASGYVLEINQGRFVVQLTDAKLSKKGIITSATTIFTVLTSEEAALYYEDLDEHRRVLGERNLATTGSLTIAVVRISAAGAPNSYTKAQLLSAWTGNGVSFKTQMNACSNGALTWTLGGYYNIVLPNTIASYGGLSGMQAAVEAQLKSIVKKDLNQVASKIAFCYPKGSGAWIASASFNWWKAQFNDLWAMSLSAQMHEVRKEIYPLYCLECLTQLTFSFSFSRLGIQSASCIPQGALRCMVILLECWVTPIPPWAHPESALTATRIGFWVGTLGAASP